MRVYDHYAIDDAAKVRYTEDGYMTATPRVARTGIQLYYGSELGLTGEDAKKVMKVYRSPDEVFKTDSLHSFGHRPITNDHPPVQVNSGNWKDYATGQAGGEVLRDGEFIRVPMVLMDADSVKRFKAGKAELSVGYDCEIEFGAGTTPDGMAYDARQKNIKANHIAVVDAARGGEKLRIGDGTGKTVNPNAHADGLRAIMNGKVDRGDVTESQLTGYLADASNKEYPFLCQDGSVSLMALRSCKADAIAKGDGDVTAAVDTMLSLIEDSTHAIADGNKETITMTKIATVDGISVEFVNDQGHQIVAKALGDSATKLADAQKKLNDTETALATVQKQLSDATAKSTTELAAKDAEIVTLKKQLEDAKLTPEKLDTLVKDRALIAGKARAVLGDKLIVDGKTDVEIMGQVVTSKLGDAAKGWNADQIKISFDTITASTKPVDAMHSGVYDTARAFSAPSTDGDARAKAEEVINNRDKRLADAWKGPAAQA